MAKLKVELKKRKIWGAQLLVFARELLDAEEEISEGIYPLLEEIRKEIASQNGLK